jgi:DNA-binding MarR family transcriptional regulator
MLARSQAAGVAARFEAAGHTGLRPGHATLLVPLLAGGRRAADLADDLGVSRQAVAQTVVTLEKGGYVQRVADPGDGRAKLICLTARGRSALRTMRAAGLAVDDEWREILGEERLGQLRALLVALLVNRGAGS